MLSVDGSADVDFDSSTECLDVRKSGDAIAGVWSAAAEVVVADQEHFGANFCTSQTWYRHVKPAVRTLETELVSLILTFLHTTMR